MGVRGVEDAGWDPYKSSVTNIDLIIRHNDEISNNLVQRNLHLWSYGHILEASEPYEKIMNLLDIITGDDFSICKFPPKKNGWPQSPGEKIATIKKKGDELGYSISSVYDEIWDRKLRNAVFHSDYILLREEVRIREPAEIYSKESINKLVNCSIAYFQAIEFLNDIFIQKYEEPTIIEPHPSRKLSDNEKAIVIVREGHGAIGIKDNWSLEQIKRGAIKYRRGRFYEDEMKALDADPLLAKLPRRE